MDYELVKLGGFPTSLRSLDGENFSVCMLISRLILKNGMMILAKKKIFKTIADYNHACLECLKIHDLISPLSF